MPARPQDDTHDEAVEDGFPASDPPATELQLLEGGEEEAQGARHYPVFADSRVFRFGTRCRSMSWPERSALQQVASDGAGGDAG
jgi:hypothetical protein